MTWRDHCRCDESPDTCPVFAAITETTFVSRFLNRLQYANGSCWDWPDVDGGKRGQVQASGFRMAATYAAWSLDVGRRCVPDGLWVLHKCDNPQCVRPEHLYVGDHDQNMRDRLNRDRYERGDAHYSRRRPEKLARGEAHPSTPLKRGDVLAIVNRRRAGETYAAIAADYPVSGVTVQNICSGKTWSHVTGITRDAEVPA